MPIKVTKNSRSARAGLIVPVGRLHRYLREGQFASRVGIDAAVYLAAVLEYFIKEILELSATAALQNNRSRVSPRHILMAIKNDEELNQMLQAVTMSQSGVMPSIHPHLLPKRTVKVADASSQEH